MHPDGIGIIKPPEKQYKTGKGKDVQKPGQIIFLIVIK